MIYLDHAATAPMRPEAISATQDAMNNTYGNASAIYRTAAKAKQTLEEAREALASTIGAYPAEIYFTSGGTESDNWALVGSLEEREEERGRKGTLVTTPIEHEAVLRTADYLARRGFGKEFLPVDKEGFVDPEDLSKLLSKRKETTPASGGSGVQAEAAGQSHPDDRQKPVDLVSVMMANNEVGTIEPVAAFAAAAKEHDVLFHTDAVQAYGKLPIDVRKLPVDFLSVSAHKIGGPKGIGFLFIRQNTRFPAFLHGGMQERGRRAGTENVPGAAGFAAAALAAMRDLDADAAREKELRTYFLRALREAIPDVILNGPEEPEKRLPNNINISIPGVDSESALIYLDMQGIAASGGSACTTGAPEPSHVLMALTGDAARAKSAIRFTLGPENTKEELTETVRVLKTVADRIRK